MQKETLELIFNSSEVGMDIDYHLLLLKGLIQSLTYKDAAHSTHVSSFMMC